ncbi:MAG TPA: MFS transporter, partial [Acidimicrobiales bacterium]|nr:MFS transporter [Acidimicrobiales bacterium]
MAFAWPPPPPPTAQPTTPAASTRSRWSLTTIALVVAIALAFADASVVVLALPDIYAELHTTIVGVSWVITAYALVVGVGALLLAPVARRANPRILVVGGLAAFALASLGAGVAHTTSSLLVARCFQGAGAALLLGAALPMLNGLCGSPAAGRRVWAGAGVIGAVIGPALGGLLTQVFDWRAIFIAQAPAAALAAAAVLAARPEPGALAAPPAEDE